MFPSLAVERDRLATSNYDLLELLKARQERVGDLEKMLDERGQTLALKSMECERLKTQVAMLLVDKPIEGKVLRPKTGADVRRIMEKQAMEADNGVR
jgi:hypothetical protein